MKPEHLQAAATLAAVIVKEQMRKDGFFTEELMTAALLMAHRAVLQAEADSLQGQPQPSAARPPVR